MKTTLKLALAFATLALSALAARAQAPDLSHIDTGLTPATDAPGLGLRDTFKLALAPQIGFELSNTPSMSRKALPAAVLVSTGCSVARNATPRPFVDNVLQVLQRPRETVDAGNNQGVAWLNEVEQHLQFGAPVAPIAAFLLSTDHAAPRRPQRPPLHGEILVQRGDARVAVGRHFVPIGSRPENRNVSVCRKQSY